MPVEGFEGGLQLDREAQRVEVPALGASFLRHAGADVLPEVAELGHLAAGDVVGDGDARELDDSALDGVHEGEVAHGPGEERALGVAGAAEEEGGGGKVDDARDAELALDGFESGDPETGGLVVFLGFLKGGALWGVVPGP